MDTFFAENFATHAYAIGLLFLTAAAVRLWWLIR